MVRKKDYSGALLKLERLKANKGQKEICQGICVVSYLSKIERCQVNPDPEILQKLFQRLGIEFFDDIEFIKSQELLIERYFQQVLYAYETTAYDELKNYDKELSYSPLFIDWLLVKAYEEDEESIEYLHKCVDFFSQEQLARYYMLMPVEYNNASVVPLYEEAHRILNDSASLLQLMRVHLLLGNYDLVNKYSNKCVTIALDEGNTWTLALCYNFQGDAYASQNLEKLMMPFYQRAINLLTGTIWKDMLSDTYYNMGATFLGADEYQLAIEYLNMATMEDKFLLYHKKALAYIRKGDLGEAEGFLESMKSWLLRNPGHLVEQLMYEEALMEREEDFLDDPKYLILMEELMKVLRAERHKGYLIFYKKIMMKAYIRQRKYKKAYELEVLLSS